MSMKRIKLIHRKKLNRQFNFLGKRMKHSNLAICIKATKYKSFGNRIQDSDLNSSQLLQIDLSKAKILTSSLMNAKILETNVLDLKNRWMNLIKRFSKWRSI